MKRFFAGSLVGLSVNLNPFAIISRPFCLRCWDETRKALISTPDFLRRVNLQVRFSVRAFRIGRQNAYLSRYLNMYCPKCGLQNADDTRFCRSCGASLSNVLAVVDGTPYHIDQPNGQNDLFSSGIRNLILGFGLIFISILIFAMPGDTLFWLLAMVPGISLLASGISRLVKADGAKATIEYRGAERESLPKSQPNAALPPIQTEYIRPDVPTDQTEDLMKAPFSVTEPTTELLEADGDPKEAGR